MSRFLGPIHTWLHDKIMLQEMLEVKFTEALSDTCGDISFLEPWDARYGSPDPEENLEDSVDGGNIHGWLAGRIARAETRFAGKFTQVESMCGSTGADIATGIFAAEGAACGEHAAASWDGQLETAYKVFNNYVLEGMPCDNVSAVTEKGDTRLVWVARRCLHQDYWTSAGGDPRNHYLLRDAFATAFFRSLGNLNYARVTDNGTEVYTLTV